MYPVNQVFLGNSDPLLSNTDITDQLQRLKAYEAQLLKLQTPTAQELIWDSIDKEMTSLSESQKAKFFEDKEYSEITASLQNMVQIELLNLVKSKIESTPEGRNLLQRQLEIVRTLKKKIVQETDNEMAIFNKFREFSKDNPSLTYEEFIKQWRSM
jgi:hypothetical protein